MTTTDPEIRKAAVAGSFYPANPIELSKTVANLFAEVEKVPLTGRPLAMIVPHSGYPYSGKIAARAFKLIDGEEYETVVVLSPSSTVFFKGCAVYDGSGYETPFGVVEIDQELSEKIASVNSNVYLSKTGHATSGARGEHALEVQLPFLQVVLRKFKLVAIVMGEQEEDTSKALGQALAATLGGTNSLIVASSNLSHFHSQKEARELDNAVQSAIEQYDPHLLMETIESGKGEASGGGVIAAALVAAKQMGGKDIKFLGYSTSAETTGEIDEVVGFMSAAILSDKKVPYVKSVAGRGVKPFTEDTDKLTEDDKVKLKQLARDVIKARLNNKDFEVPELKLPNKQRGVYVTIIKGDKVITTAGRVRIREQLHMAVADMSTAAASQAVDSNEIKSNDIDKIEIKLSILSQLERVKQFNEIKIGRHGLMIKLDMHSGILLPFEAARQNWEVTRFLEQLCLKAGLSKNSYRDKFAEIYKFTAEEF